VFGIDVGMSSGWAPDTTDLTCALAAAADIEVGEASAGDATADGRAAEVGLGEAESVGLLEPHAATSEPTAIATTIET
jgi:hypothetical protein